MFDTKIYVLLALDDWFNMLFSFPRMGSWVTAYYGFVQQTKCGNITIPYVSISAKNLWD
jgi:hypothetical protein